MTWLKRLILPTFLCVSGMGLYAQRTTIINHFPQDTTGKNLLPVKTAEHRIVINYYEPADTRSLDQFQDLVSAYLNLYIDKCAVIDNGDIKLKKSKKATKKELDQIVIGALDFYEYEKLKEFKGFSKMVENKINAIEAIDFNKSEFAAGAADHDSKERMQKFYLQKELSDLKLLVNMEVGIYGNDNLMVVSSSDETIIDEDVKQRIIDQYTNYDPNQPLEPIKVKLSDESMALINFKDASTIDGSGKQQSPNSTTDQAFLDQVLQLLEANNSKLDGMQAQINELRTEQMKLWQQQQDDKNFAMQKQIDDLREMVFALVKMNTGEPLANAGSDIVKPGKSESTVTNLPKSMNVYFEKSSSSLDAGSKLSLNEIVDILARSPSLKLIVTGYADKTGDAAKNLLLSQQRANEVKKFLAASGLSQERFITKYFGDRDSSHENSNDRRVEIEFVR